MIAGSAPRRARWLAPSALLVLLLQLLPLTDSQNDEMARGAGDSTPRHEWSTRPWAPPKSEAPEHVAETYGGMNHELLLAKAKERDAEEQAKRDAVAAVRAAEDKSPEAFLKAVRSFLPGDYYLLFRCAPACQRPIAARVAAHPPPVWGAALAARAAAVQLGTAVAITSIFHNTRAFQYAGTASWTRS